MDHFWQNDNTALIESKQLENLFVLQNVIKV